MNHIYEANEQFDFNKLISKKPVSQSGGSFLIKFSMNDIPLYIQTPKCSIKQNIIKPTKKQLYCDLVFLQENENFIQWMENLENYSQQVIFKNKSQWFETELELEDIENSFTSPLKSYKSGKSYIVRTNIPNVLGKSNMKIYDEDENTLDLECLSENMQAITILEVQGIRCSARSFQIELELKQMMVLKSVNLFEKCILKPRTIISNSSPYLGMNPPIPVFEEPIENTPDIEEPTEEPIKESDNQEMIESSIQIDTPIINDMDEPNILKEIDFDLEKIDQEEPVTLRKRNEVYYEMYKEARRKAKVARDLALSSYLEAKRIKNTYMLDDIIDSDEDSDDDDDEDEDSEDGENES